MDRRTRESDPPCEDDVGNRAVDRVHHRDDAADDGGAEKPRRHDSEDVKNLSDPALHHFDYEPESAFARRSASSSVKLPSMTAAPLAICD